MSKNKLIAIFTGNRAEYGLLSPIIKSIKESKKLNYSLIVSGAHVDLNFGNTKKEIKKDGFKISKLIQITNNDDNLASTTKSIGNGVLKISETLSKIKPSILIVYADRFEGFAAVISASQMGIPVAHIEGGDITNGGALDDTLRHAMTKLSHIHFCTNENSKNRILKLGEERWRVKNYGFPLLDLCKQKNYLPAKETLKKYNLFNFEKIIIFTQHSVSTQYEKAKFQILPSLKALKYFSKKML